MLAQLATLLDFPPTHPTALQVILSSCAVHDRLVDTVLLLPMEGATFYGISPVSLTLHLCFRIGYFPVTCFDLDFFDIFWTSPDLRLGHCPLIVCRPAATFGNCHDWRRIRHIFYLSSCLLWWLQLCDNVDHSCLRIFDLAILS